jgi:hypothetical protein
MSKINTAHIKEAPPSTDADKDSIMGILSMK